MSHPRDQINKAPPELQAYLKHLEALALDAEYSLGDADRLLMGLWSFDEWNSHEDHWEYSQPIEVEFRTSKLQRVEEYDGNSKPNP